MTAVFWITAVIAVLSGLNVILQRNPIYSALFLVATMFCVAVFYLLLEVWFQVDLYKGPVLDRLIDLLR